MKHIFSRFVMVLTVLAMLGGALAFNPTKVQAATDTFNVSVYHGINGRSLGLSRDLPVIAEVYKDGAKLADIPLSFMDRFATSLPAGNYLIKVWSVELGAYVDSMQVGPVNIPAGVDVRLKAMLSADKTPIINVRVTGGEKPAHPTTFNVSVVHGINGRNLGLSRELPVVAEVYKDGAKLAEIPLSFKDRFTAELPAGNYEIKVWSVELGAYVDSMTVGPVDLPAGIDLGLRATLENGTPVLKVKIK